MLLPRLQPPLRAAAASAGRPCGSSGSQSCLNEVFSRLKLSNPRGQDFVRQASHKAQGAVNKGKDGPGKRLGAKKTGEQYVIPGNIIYRQRGTLWFPGDNCGMGTDHTIYATESGYVKYYKDPAKHPKRQYIGVVFERDQTLPVPRNAPRRRRLGMFAQPMPVAEPVAEPGREPGLQPGPTSSSDLLLAPDGDDAATPGPPDAVRQQRPTKERRGEEGRRLVLKQGYMYREANWQIGRAAERAGVRVVKFDRGNRWRAWRKRRARVERSREKKIMRTRTKAPKKAPKVPQAAAGN